MNPKKIWGNFAVTDLEKTTKFYSEIGFKFKGKSEDLVSFLVGENDFVIHFFLKEKIEANTKIKFSNTMESSEIMFTLSAETKQQVDDSAKEIENAGGKIISQPEEFGKGYYGFVFADPDGHKFNVFFMEEN
jgi:predicted lactoylglutathione lyase